MNVSPKQQLRFPIWKFLTQRVFDAENPLHLLPHHYWNFYQRYHLETCWSMHYQPEQGSRNS